MSEAASCPICLKSFKLEEIETHVNACCDSLSNPSPNEGNKKNDIAQINPIDNKPEKPITTEKKRAAETDNPNDEQEYFNHFKRKKLQEEEDAKFAALLQQQLEQKKSEGSNSDKDRDMALALEIMEKEEKEFNRKLKEIEEQDIKLAQELADSEKEKIQAKKVEANDFETTLQLIKEESTRDKEQELLKTKQEKERLLKELEKLKKEQNNIKKQTSLVEYPEYWKNQNADYVVYDVYAGTNEWVTVQTRFSEAMPGAVVLTIQRNQNQDLWKWYYLKRKEIARKSGDKNGNEQYLFYESRGVVLNAYNNGIAAVPYAAARKKKRFETGVANATKDDLDDILKNGIDTRVADLNGQLGSGVYFAKDSSVADGHCTKNRGGSKKALLCRVALGDVGNGQQGLRRPPEKQKGWKSTIVKYDPFNYDVPKTTGAAVSLYDSTGKGNEYCIFENRQSYPEYIIEYDDAGGNNTMQVDHYAYDDNDGGDGEYMYDQYNYPPPPPNGFFNNVRTYFGYK